MGLNGWCEKDVRVLMFGVVAVLSMDHGAECWRKRSRQKYVDVWICFETDSSRKPSLDELSTSKDFEMCSKRVGRSTFRFTTETRFFRITCDTYAYTEGCCRGL